MNTLNASLSDKPRRVLGYYEIVKKLGEGAFGEIYLGRNVKDGS
jgi:serine/threonine protein kinase